jgi:site-specific DNA-methyltransferase (adenine-specific)
MNDYNPQKDAHDSYYAAIEAKRLRGDSIIRKEVKIGECRLILGDSRAVVPSLKGIGAVVSDPPFGMAFRSNHRAIQHEAIANDGDTELLKWACDLQADHSKYIFCRWDNLAELPKPKSMVTWVKNNWSMGDLQHEHARQTEVALFYPGKLHDFPNGRPTDVIEAPRTGNTFHPTEKPVQLMMAILRWTRGTVLDPFMGSGSTGVACARAGRSFIGVEIDEGYFETACRRVREAYSAPDMFVQPRAPDPVQEALL